MQIPGASSGTTAIEPRNPTAWQPATVLCVREETPRVTTIRLTVGTWPGHVPGQHADVRLTAEDGYRAERSYSIASPPEVSELELTVERLDHGEVSPFLTTQLHPGDSIELRGPIGRHFVWSARQGQNPLFVIAGGSGIVPLMCMLRHRLLSGSGVPAALLYSSRTRDDVIYHQELRQMEHRDPQFALRLTLTRDFAPGWAAACGRIDVSMVYPLLESLGGTPDTFVCGPTGFVEVASALLVQAGQRPEAIRTERFGPSGTVLSAAV